eukprot:5035058-Amphidinium_carterae.1
MMHMFEFSMSLLRCKCGLFKVVHTTLKSRSACSNLACDSFTTNLVSSAGQQMWPKHGQFIDVSRSRGCADDPTKAAHTTLKSKAYVLT